PPYTQVWFALPAGGSAAPWPRCLARNRLVRLQFCRSAGPVSGGRVGRRTLPAVLCDRLRARRDVELCRAPIPDAAGRASDLRADRLRPIGVDCTCVRSLL